MRGTLLSGEDRQKVSEAIRAAEEGTSGEIYCVIARSSDDYFYPAAFALTTGVLAASLFAGLVLRLLWFDIGAIGFVLVQVAALFSGFAVLRLAPGLRIHLVPRRLRDRRAHDNAVRQFLAHNVHLTGERTGVLIFVSLAERYAEVVADAGIASAVPGDAWDEIVSALVREARAGRYAQGFIQAVAMAGELLAGHFPARPGDHNELDDHLVEI